MPATTYRPAARAWRLPAPLHSMRYVMHLGLTAMVGAWSVVLFMPWPTFPTSKAYSEFAAICPDEQYWATGFALACMVGIAGCWAAWPGARPSRRRDAVRVFSAIVLGVNHGIIAWLTLKGSPTSTGGPIYALIMLMAYILAASEAERLG